MIAAPETVACVVSPVKYLDGISDDGIADVAIACGIRRLGSYYLSGAEEALQSRTAAR